MKVAIYARVSTADQELEQQIEPLIKHCKDKQWTYDVFKDVISGAKDTRPSLDMMMQRIRLNEFNTVMVWKLDRLGRSTLHLIQLIEEFKNKNVQFIALTQGVDTLTAQGKFFFMIMAAVAELERELIKERTKLRIDRLKAQGKHLGRPKGSKDKDPRRKSGYQLRWAVKKPTPEQIADIRLKELQDKTSGH